MIDTPHVAEAPEQITAVIRLTVPMADMSKVMGPAIQELLAAVAAQGRQCAGAVYDRVLRMDKGTFDLELGVPVAKPIAAAGRVKPGRLPAATVARTTYHGPYEGLGGAWGEFDAWVRAQGHTPAPDLWECYVAGPESGPDSSQWRTELNRPLLQRKS